MKLVLVPFILSQLILTGSAQLSSSAVGKITLRHGQGGGGGIATSTADKTVLESSVSTGEAIGSTAYSRSYGAAGGFIAQLVDPIDRFHLTADPVFVDVDSSSQLIGFRELDDGTFLRIEPTQITWSIQSGPLESIALTGIATGQFPVSEDSLAVVEGAYQTFSSITSLIVLDTDHDDLGMYANDGLNDSWQMIHFGTENPEAAPSEDPDGDGLSNAFEFLAMVDPTDLDSTFEMEVQEAASQTGVLDVVISPVFPSSRTYTLEYSFDLSEDGWDILAGSSETTVDDQMIFRDPDPGIRKFYQVVISE